MSNQEHHVQDTHIPKTVARFFILLTSLISANEDPLAYSISHTKHTINKMLQILVVMKTMELARELINLDERFQHLKQSISSVIQDKLYKACNSRHTHRPR